MSETINEVAVADRLESLIGHRPESVNGVQTSTTETTTPTKRPTAAESLAKQRAADKAAKEASKKSTTKVKTKTDKSKFTGARILNPKPAAKKTTKKEKKTVTATKPNKKEKKAVLTVVVAKRTTKPKLKPTITANGKRRGRTPKTGLRDTQLRALDILSDPTNRDGLPLDKIAKKAKISKIVMRRGIGPIDRDCIKSHENTFGFRSLVGLGHVKVHKREYDERNDVVFVLTPSGVKAAERNREKIDALGKPHPAPYTIHTNKKRWWKK